MLIHQVPEFAENFLFDRLVGLKIGGGLKPADACFFF